MSIQILSKESHVHVAVINSEGEIISWQAQPFFTLADLYPQKVLWMLNRTALTRPDAEDTLRNIRVFTGCVYLKLSEDDEQRIKDGPSTSSGQASGLIDDPITVTFTNGNRESFIFNSLWSSATKNHTLTGYTRDLNAPLRKVFNYAESGVRVGRATRGGFSNGKVKDYPVAFLPQDTLLDFGLFSKPLGDGEFLIRVSDATPLRQAMSYMGRLMDSFTLGQWRLSAQITSQIKHPYDKEGVILELLPHVAQGLDRINDHTEFIAHTFNFEMKDESKQKLLELAETMYDHPDLNKNLSSDKARTIFDVIATGKPKSIQGFVAIAGGLEGCAVFPSQQTRFPKSELYLLARYPVNNSRCIMPVVAIQEGPQADFLNEIEQFQGTMFGNDGAGQFMAAGQFIVVPDEYWPAEYADVKLIICSKNIKVHSTWKSAEDVKAMQNGTRQVSYTGYISVCQWARKGNAVLVDPLVWKEANGDFDFDEGEAIPESEFPLLFEAFRKEWEITTGLAVSKLPKIYTFDDPKASRVKTLTDTLAGAMAVGLAANCNLVILNNNPLRWSEMATRIDSDAFFYGQMVDKGYIVESYPDELVAWFMEICDCDAEAAKQVIRMFYVLSFFIQCGVDGFKTNLSNIGGMQALVKEISRVWKVLTEELMLSQRLIQFNPKKSPTALRDKDHLPTFEADEETFGVSESLMKLAINGFTWDGWPYCLELPDYLYLGALPDSFKYYAVGPRTLEELEACRLLRRVCRDELARRSMMTPLDWAYFAEKVWTPLLVDFQANARVILRYSREMKDDASEHPKGCGKPAYSVLKERKFPTLQGITWERIAHLLWFAFHDTGGKSTGSAIPLFWVEQLREYLFDILKNQPGWVDLQDEFDLPVVGLDKAGIEREVTHLIEVRIDRVKEAVEVGVDEDGQPLTLTAERSRNYIEFAGGRYIMFPKDGPLLGGARFSVTFRREGSKDIGHFVRVIPVSTIDLSARLAEIQQGN